jgi:hypothetical protein
MQPIGGDGAFVVGLRARYHAPSAAGGGVMRRVVLALVVALGWATPAWPEAMGVIVQCGDPLGEWI